MLFRPKARADANVLLEGRWAPGVWLGRRWGSPVSRVHAGGEVVDARALQRVPLAERWSAAPPAEIRATPWCVRQRPLGDAEPLVVLQPLPPDQVPPPPPRAHPEYRPRRVFIAREDLDRFGYTVNCRRCTLVREGARPRRSAQRGTQAPHRASLAGHRGPTHWPCRGSARCRSRRRGRSGGAGAGIANRIGCSAPSTGSTTCPGPTTPSTCRTCGARGGRPSYADRDRVASPRGLSPPAP